MIRTSFTDKVICAIEYIGYLCALVSRWFNIISWSDATSIGKNLIFQR